MMDDLVWHEYEQPDGRKCQPDSERRVLVAQDDGYIEMAYWNGDFFEHDWPSIPMSGDPARPPHPFPRKVARVRYWTDLPEAPTEDGDTPY